MKQSVIDQMRKYQHKQKIVEAIEYKEGMEDAWLVRYKVYNSGNSGTALNLVKSKFDSKEEAIEYINNIAVEANRHDFCEYTEPFPVILREIDEDEYENDCLFQITYNGQYFEYEALEEGYWIYIEDGNVFIGYDSDSFFSDFEPLSTADVSAFIGYDKDLKELYVEINNTIVIINNAEIATVEKLLEGFSIPYTERVGQAFLDGRN